MSSDIVRAQCMHKQGRGVNSSEKGDKSAKRARNQRDVERLEGTKEKRECVYGLRVILAHLSDCEKDWAKVVPDYSGCWKKAWGGIRPRAKPKGGGNFSHVTNSIKERKGRHG